VRTHHYLLLAALSLAACSKKNSTPFVLPVIYKDTAATPPFISAPLAANQLQLTFPWSINLAKVYLKQDTTVLGVFPAVPQPEFSYFANINYPFVAGQHYDFVVESAPVNGVAIRYHLLNYTHTYLALFTYQKLLSLTQSLGPNEFDISPSHNYLFITDDVKNTIVTKRLSLTDGSIDTISNIPYGFLRAVSDNEILAPGYSYNGRPFGGDTTVVLRYNIFTKQSSFVTFASGNYGRQSRIIDNHIIVTQPVFPGNSVLLNLADTSKIVYPGSTVNFSLIGENNFDHLYYANQLVDPVTGAFKSILPATDSAGIDIIDSSTGYAITSWYSTPTGATPPVAYFKSHFGVYAQGNYLYQSDNATNLTYSIPRRTSITGNRILFYQSFGWDSTFHISGYYQLDLNTKTTTLLHCITTPYIVEDFQFDPHTMISVHSDGVYRVTLP
jgi:hypothetical protein